MPVWRRILKCRVAWLAMAVVTVALVLFFTWVAQHEPDPQETIVLGQSRLFADSAAAFRVLVRDRVQSTPVPAARVQMAIEGPAQRDLSRAGTQAQGRREELGSFTTDESGSLSDVIHVPALDPGRYRLIVESSSRVGSDRIVVPIEVKHACRVYVATDKTIYQPGQTIHMRALALDEVSLKPFTGQPIRFEVTDAKGNKVHKADLTTSPYGMASCDFILAGEVHLGDYQVRVTTGNVESDRTVQVQRYVLPKFKLALTADKPFYLRSEKVHGEVRATYFFGKPVANAQVTAIGRTSGREPEEIFRVVGTTDPNGLFSFDAVFSERFARDREADPEEPDRRRRGVAGQENTPFEITVVAKDSAEHEETIVERRTIAGQAINIHVFPEGDGFLEDVENTIYVLTAYPTGQPAVCDVQVNGTALQSDPMGVTVLKISPRASTFVLNIKAQDASGLAGSWIGEMSNWGSRNDLQMRTDKAVYQAGEKLQVTILSSGRRDVLFLDVLRHGQTVLTRTLRADEEGQAHLTLDLPTDLWGTLVLKAYVVSRGDSIDMETRVVHVRQADELRIGTSLDKPVYRPGDTAHVRFQITDTGGAPVAAALSLAAVDEAVFYVCENQPGRLDQFFLTDGRLPLAGYQMAFAVSPAKLLSGEEPYQNLARALLSWGGQEAGWSREYRNRSDDIGTQIYEIYDHTNRQEYSLQAESYPGKLARADAFRQRYLRFPLAALAIFAILLIPLGVLGVFTHSLFRLFRETATGMESQASLSRGAIRRIYLFTLVVLLPMATYLTALLLSESFISIYSYRHRGIGARVLGVLVVALPVLAGVAFPAAGCFGSTSPKPLRRTPIKGLTLFLVCMGLAVVIQYVAARAITDLRNVGTGFAVLLLGLPAFVSIALCCVADGTSRRAPGRFYAELGRSGRIVLVGLIAQTLVLPAWLLLPPMPETVWRMAKGSRRAPARRFLVHPGERPWSGYSAGMGGIAYYADLGEMMGGMGMGGQAPSPPREPPRVRRFFPETLLWQPQVITDEAGRADVQIPLADSITTWKMNIDAVSAGGGLGNAVAEVRVFQDFFVDLDLPAALTRGDEISVPVLCHNYLPQAQTIQLTLESASWYEVQGSAAQQVALAPNDVKSVSFRVKARDVGTHKLGVLAQGSSLSDAVRRSIEVRPDGVPVEDLQGGILSRSAEHTFNVPPESIPNSQKLLLKLYPSMFSEVLEGLDAIFRMPQGCFEQTSSATYPNIMALLYLRRTGQITPEVEAKARAYIAAGYQKLLTFKIEEGGFEWFGHPPARERVTAYGIMQLTDMAQVHDVDPGVIEHASQWLLSRQYNDGSWDESDQWQGAGRRDTRVRETAYIAWALAEARVDSFRLARTLEFLRQNVRETDSPYTLALAANALLAVDPNDAFGHKLVAGLRSSFHGDGRLGWVSSGGTGAMYSRGSCLDIETTALSVLAMMKVNAFADMVPKALAWLCEQKDRHGTWHSTQATVLAMKALIAGTDMVPKSDAPTRIGVMVNDGDAGSIEVTAQTRDLLHTLDLTSHLKPGANTVRLTREGGMELPYRLVGTHWVSQNEAPTALTGELEIEAQYDRNHLRVGDPLRCTVQVLDAGATPANMLVMELSVPPGFAVDPSAFERLVDSGTFARYESASDRVVVYIRSITPKRRLRFSYELRALRSARVQVPPTCVYEYYQPQNRAQTMSHEIIVD